MASVSARWWVHGYAHERVCECVCGCLWVCVWVSVSVSVGVCVWMVQVRLEWDVNVSEVSVCEFVKRCWLVSNRLNDVQGCFFVCAWMCLRVRMLSIEWVWVCMKVCGCVDDSRLKGVSEFWKEWMTKGAQRRERASVNTRKETRVGLMTCYFRHNCLELQKW